MKELVALEHYVEEAVAHQLSFSLPVEVVRRICDLLEEGGFLQYPLDGRAPTPVLSHRVRRNFSRAQI